MADIVTGKRLTLFLFVFIGIVWEFYVVSAALKLLSPYTSSFFMDVKRGPVAALPWVYQGLYWFLVAAPGVILILISWVMLRKLDSAE